MFISIFDKYFYMIKITRARNVQAKPSSQVSDPCVRFWSWLFDRGFQVVGLGWQIFRLRSYVLGPGFWVLGF